LSPLFFFPTHKGKKTMRSKRRIRNTQHTSHQVSLITLGILLGCVVLIGIVVPFVFSSPNTQRNHPNGPATYPPTSQQTTTVTNASVTTVVTTTPIQTTTPPVTTPPPPPVNITCPPTNYTIFLGTSLLPSNTGGAASAGGGCTTPLVIYSDAHLTVPLNGPNVLVVPTILTQNTPELLNCAYANASSYLCVYTNGNHTTLMLASNGTSFALNSVQNNCTSANNNGQGQVLWDTTGQWIVSYVNGNSICLFVSNTSNPFGAWYSYQLVGFDLTPVNPILARWARVYALTMDWTSGASLCVIDRLRVLSGTFNSTYFFCKQPLYGHLWQWTPVSAVEGAVVSSITEASSTGTVGAVFMRLVDDEFFFGATNTPTSDQIEVEHWTNIVFENRTYSSYRYKIAVADFDSAASSDYCIDTPTAFKLDSRRKTIAPRLTYQYNPFTNRETLLLLITDRANCRDYARIRWIQLVWESPSVFTPPLWRLRQQGLIQVQNAHAWLPTGATDLAGNMLVAFAVSNNQTQYPALYATSMLDSDEPAEPLSVGQGMRNITLVLDSDLGAILTSNATAFVRSMSVLPDAVGHFFFAGGVTYSNGGLAEAHVIHLRLQDEIINRTWTSYDTCQSRANCTQQINCLISTYQS
jgi:hypothetical protein